MKCDCGNGKQTIWEDLCDDCLNAQEDYYNATESFAPRAIYNTGDTTIPVPVTCRDKGVEMEIQNSIDKQRKNATKGGPKPWDTLFTKVGSGSFTLDGSHPIINIPHSFGETVVISIGNQEFDATACIQAAEFFRELSISLKRA